MTCILYRIILFVNFLFYLWKSTNNYSKFQKNKGWFVTLIEVNAAVADAVIAVLIILVQLTAR